MNLLRKGIMFIWFVYIIKSTVTGKLYIGISNHPLQRLMKHNLGKGAKSTRAGRPWEIVFLLRAGTKSEALKKEYRMKQLTRREKLTLVQESQASLEREFLKLSLQEP